ncbi:ParB/RepB/Spo0J family partition protein [Elioraea tepidiphila]|jgi:ParB family chromosome partitioning protein|uniref:ParB/RepB/Spo0J family partition protein n=1 Tax=Elioraea tepidiphila TaxID=457934 RepID=UPI00037CAA14|nr:ParB/RepB/Spo0J family partition protein [Elioraea tepidiphila]
MSPKRDASKRLGRGLAALLGDAASAPPAPAEASVPAGDVQSVPIAALEPSPFQPRSGIKPEGLEELIASIRERGILQPLLVRPHPEHTGRYQIIAGERRWRAAQAIPLHEVPVLVRALSDLEAAAAALVENLQRTDLDPIEEAEGLMRLIETHKLSQEEIGRMIGKSRSHVANTIRLVNLPAIVQQHVREGRLTAGHARALLGAKNPEALAARVVEQGLSVRQTEALVAAEAQAGPKKGPPRAVDPNLASLERDLKERLGVGVHLRPRGQGGELRLRYANLDQLDGLLALLMRES